MNAIRNAISRDDLKWNYEHPDIFYLPQWQTGSRIDTFYVAYKILWNCFYLGVLSMLIYVGQPFPFLVRFKAACYYTFWVFFLCMASALLSLVAVGRQYRQQRRNNANGSAASSTFYKTQWIVQTMTLDSSIAVSLGYFSLEFFYQLRPYGAGTSAVHLWNTLLVIMDYFISSIPVKLIHIYPSLLFACLYGIFTYAYYVSGGLGMYDHHYLYRILDYKHNPALAVVALIIILLYIVIGRVFLCYCDKLKRKLYYKYYLCNELIEVTRHVPREISKF